MTTTLVMKFGGTSVGSAKAIRQAAALIQKAQKEFDQVAVVISAMSGVTNLLLEGAEAAVDGDTKRSTAIAEALKEKHNDAIFDLIRDPKEQENVYARMHTLVDEFSDLTNAVSKLGEATPRAMDFISSLGERINIHTLAAYLREQDCMAEAVESKDLILTDSTFQNGKPDMDVTQEQTQARIAPLFAAGSVPIITGFMGANADGVIVTLGRGGSDYAAAIVASALDADELWIWTDVPGVMSADPRVVKNARTLRRLTFREVSELAHFGAKVLHPKTMRPIVGTKCKLWIKDTFDPDGPATLVVNEYTDAEDLTPIRAVTAIKNQAMLTVEGRGMLGVPGIAARAFGAVAGTNASVILISQSSSEQSIAMCLNASAADDVVVALNQEFAREIERRDIDSIKAQRDIVIVTVVGARIQDTPGVAGQVFTQLGENNINVVAIATGSSECSISLVVNAKDTDGAVAAIHKLIEK